VAGLSRAFERPSVIMPENAADRPPWWAEQLLRVFLKRRDRDTVAGDLLEEYRERVLPRRGRWRAQVWYLRQALSLIDGVMLGFMLGAAFGVWNLVATRLDPLADDTPAALLTFYGPMFSAWGLAGFAAARRSGRFIDGVTAGATVSFVTFVVFAFANLVRVNLFLEEIVHRADWQNMVMRFHASGFDSLRAFVNYNFVTGFPFKIFVASLIGATVGSMGGLLATIWRREVRRLPQR
jgi:hypothetical protein